MSLLECMNTTIEYIEEHLLQELSMPMIAKATGSVENLLCVNGNLYR